MKIPRMSFDSFKHIAEEVKEIRTTYSLLRKLSSINGTNINEELLDRAMYESEALPPLGKEYWWFLFFGRDRKQMMLLVFRKHGRNMIFNNEETMLKKIDANLFQAVTAGWIYDGKTLRDLGDSNSIVEVSPREKMIISQVSNQKIIFRGGFPDYELKIDGLVHLKITKGDFLENRCAHGVFIPPFGVGWVDVFSNVEGDILGEGFNGTAHLQKVVGVMPYGSFHWARVVFENGSMFSLFCLKLRRDSSRYFRISINFYDHETRRYIRFRKPRLTVTKENVETRTWTIRGWDRDHVLKTVLKSYAEKSFTMNGGGSQTYIEYAVMLKKFSLKTRDRTIVLNNLGEGIGTFEDAYGSPIF